MFTISEMDKYLYTIIVENDVIGHVYQLKDTYVIVTGDYPLSNIREVIYTHKKSDNTMVMADYPLQTLSSRLFVITYDYDMVYGKYMYTTSSLIPTTCVFLLMMIIDQKDIIDYVPHPVEEMFVKEGYVRELKKAKHVIIPTNTYEGDTSDLLIAHRSGNILTSVNGKKTTLNVTNPSRHIIANPTFYGEGVDVPYTYTIDSLIAKTKELNDRLEEYGEGRVNSMIRSLSCMIERMSTDANKFVTSTNYNYVVEMLRLML